MRILNKKAVRMKVAEAIRLMRGHDNDRALSLLYGLHYDLGVDECGSVF